MGLLEQGDTSGPLLLDLWKTIHLAIHPTPVHVMTVLQHDPLFPLLWEMTTFVRVEIQDQDIPKVDFMQMTHSGMVRVVGLPPAVS